MSPAQAVELQHQRLVLLRCGVAFGGIWSLAGRIDAQPVIAEPGRDALLAQQSPWIAGVSSKLQAHADPHRQSFLLPHPREGTHAVGPIRQVADAGDAQRISLFLPRYDPSLF